MSFNTKRLRLPWLFLMAFRDSRKNKSRLFLFTSSIILGIAALVAINSFGDNLKDEIDQEAKTLLGADLVISTNKPLSDKAKCLIDSIGKDHSEERSFASMLVFAKTGETRLVQIRALQGAFPYYGSIETEPEKASISFKTSKKALVDNTLLLQFNSKIGDSIRVGTETFVIEGKLKKIPGQAGIAASVAPAVYIPLQYLKNTGLEKKGSRILYRYYYKFPQSFNLDASLEKIKEKLDKESLNYETVKMRKKSTTEAFKNLTSFMNLVAFVALLLGCVGVASSVHIYIKEKISSVAILRCIGLSGKQAFLIYLIQVVMMGIIGSVIGVILGSLLQKVLPLVLKDFLPLDINIALSVPAVAEGIIIGITIALLFGLIPLLNIRKVSPLLTLRSFYEETKSGSIDWMKYFVYALILGFIFFFAYNQIQVAKDAFIFTVALVMGVLVLTAVGFLIMFLVKRYFPVSLGFVWRQGLANLYRPNNQTLILITAIGLGTALITTLYFVQALLVNQVAIKSDGQQANMILFDIQTPQKDKVADLTKEFGMPIIQKVPIVTMRLEAINGQDKFEIEKDSTKKLEDWVFNREYRVTFRDTLTSSEKISEGKWYGKVKNDTIFISLDERFAGNMKVKIGDRLTFNVQGTPIETVIGSFRKIQWNRIQTNFIVLFPKGVLEQAPQFHVIATRAESQKKSASFQQALVKTFPNVSVVDITLILNAVKEIVDRVSFVIKFMALFSIITGLFVLTGSVLISKYQRMNESILLRTLGASKNQILLIALTEYFLLGSLSSFTGILIALAAGWSFAYFNLDSPFLVDYLPVFLIYVLVTGLTIFIGLINSRGVVRRPPLEILRAEA